MRCAWVAALLLSGCAAAPRFDAPSAAGIAIELHDTPFFAQLDHQCGPAALATVLVASGVDTAPQALTPQIYLPKRQGSLQTELIAATRRHARVPVRLEPRLDAIVGALHEARPVLVLLNLGFAWWPVWHYAVVVGFEPASGEFVLRSGRERRQRWSATRLHRAWARAGQWAVVAAPLETVPEVATTQRWLAAVAPFESLGQVEAAQRGFAAATRRWPESGLTWTALGNAQLAAGQRLEAVRAYSQALRIEDGVVTRNNRADALIGLGCAELAQADLRRARALDPDRRFAAVLAATAGAVPGADHCPDAVGALVDAAASR